MIIIVEVRNAKNLALTHGKGLVTHDRELVKRGEDLVAQGEDLVTVSSLQVDREGKSSWAGLTFTTNQFSRCQRNPMKREELVLPALPPIWPHFPTLLHSGLEF